MQQMLSINARPQDAYRRQDILTASPVDLIVMLYDALKKNIIMGRRAIDKREIEPAHRHLIKAQDIVSELMKSLDMSYQISEELQDIYVFILNGLSEANIKKDASGLQPILEIVEDLRSAWQEISKSNRGSLHASGEF